MNISDRIETKVKEIQLKKYLPHGWNDEKIAKQITTAVMAEARKGVEGLDVYTEEIRLDRYCKVVMREDAINLFKQEGSDE